uniref:hypothetical protein n=1 Tax=uncultured Altererythrobacter sp. TaxID=500840 RepID=UPI0026395F46|nr:hypothetical protein [uncultured Altererythrobacter sp.]
MMREDRRLRSGQTPTLSIILTWCLASAILIVIGAPQILAGQYHGPDDALRMVQVRDLLAGQGWYDLHQYRMTPPNGTLMHWSRLVDVPIAALVLFFSLFLEAHAAERVTMVVVPLFALLLTMLVTGRLAWRLFDRKTAILACLVMLLLPVIMNQFKPMRIDHHAWQILTVAVAVWCISWRKPGPGGAMAGLAMAAGLMISLEVILIAAGFGLILAMRWLRDQSARWWLVSYLQALALGMVVLFAATRGWVDLAQHCDAISLAHLGFFVIAALGAGTLAVPSAIPRIQLIVGLGISGVAGLSFFAWLAPQCLALPFSDLDPLVREFWYLNILEGRPVWFAPPVNAVAAVAQPLFAILIALYLALQNRDWLRSWWFEYAALLLIAYIGGLLTIRSIAFASVLAAIPIGWFVVRMFDRWRAYKTLLPKLGVAIVLYFLLLPAFPLVLKNALIPSQESSEMGALFSETKCDLAANVGLLNAVPAGNIFAPLDMGAPLLYQTHHSVVASGHHRTPAAMRDVIAGFVGTPEIAKNSIDRHGADYVFMCTDLLEPRNFSRRGGEDSLASRLIADKPPQWLERVDLDGPDEFRVWRVIRD